MQRSAIAPLILAAFATAAPAIAKPQPYESEWRGGGNSPVDVQYGKLCEGADPLPNDDHVRPLRVYTKAYREKGVVGAYVTACMVAPKRERAGVSVAFQLFEARNHWWGEDGQSICQSANGMSFPQCHDDRFVSGALVKFTPRDQVQSAREHQVLVIVNWTDCAGPAEPGCKGTARKEFYLMPAVELP